MLFSAFTACLPPAPPTDRRLPRTGPLLWLVLLGTLIPTLAPAQGWTAELSARAGTVDGLGALAEVFKVVIGPGGEILAAQPTTASIAVFDSTGAYHSDMGGRGSGPGEFQVVAAMGWTGDTLWAMDAGASRLNLFDRNLQFVRTITPRFSDLPEGVARAFPGPLMADGSLLAIPMMLPGSAAPHPLILVDEAGSVLRTLPPVSQEGSTVMVDRGDGQLLPISNPWDDAPLWTVGGGGESIVIVHRPIAESAEDGSLRIVRLALSGDTLLDREYRYNPRSVDAAASESVYRRAAADLGQASTPVEEVARRIRDAAPAPAFHPTVTELIAGDDGAIWLRREAGGGAEQEWQRFSESGEMQGTVRLPASLRVHGADGRRLWGVTRDELDVNFVEVYRLQPREAPAAM